MAEQINVDLLVQAISKGFDKLGKDMSSLGQAAEKQGKQTQSFGQQASAAFGTFAKGVGIAAAGIAVFGKTFDTVMDFGRAGAELELTEMRFDRLSESIGTTADALITKLGAATGGMMSNAEMMASASQIISLGLADTEEGVVDLASLIGQLGWDMQQVILTFANNSKMRLDALGLSVSDVEARARKLEAAGYDMDRAFDLAVIEAGKAKLDLLGSSVDTAVGDFARMEAEIANASNALKTALAPALTRVAQAVSGLLGGLQNLREALQSQRRYSIESGASFREYADNLGIAGEAIRVLNVLTFGRVEAVYNEQQQTDTLTAIYKAAGVAAYEWSDATRELGDAGYYSAKALAAQEDLTWRAYTASEEFRDRLDRLNDEAATLIENAQKAKPPVDDLLNSLDQDISSPLEAFIRDLQFFIASGGQDFKAAFTKVQEALAAGKITPEQAQAFTGEILAAINNVEIAMGDVSFEDAAAALSDTLKIPLEEAKILLNEVGTAADIVFETNRVMSIDKTDVESAFDLMMELEQSINNVTGTHSIHFNISQSGNIPLLPTSPGAPFKPVAQQTGGIIPGSFSQPVPIVAHGGELVANPQQQARLLDAIMNGRGGGSAGSPAAPVVQVFLDSQLIAARVRYLNAQDTRLKQRSGYGFTGS